jgi:hypothetical protein
MVEVFVIQLLAAALGAVSIAVADRSQNRGRISLRLHTSWVSASIAAIYLPVLWWTADIFLGPGPVSELVALTVVGTIFVCVYQNLPQPRFVRNPERYASPPRPSAGAVPPVAKSNG